MRNGASEIIPVGDVELAYQLKEENSDCVLMGERKGKIQPGFDYGNSPTEIEAIDFSGKTIIQTTSAGTQGFANAKEADELISGSFVNAGAIVHILKRRHPRECLWFVWEHGPSRPLTKTGFVQSILQIN